MVKTKEFVTIIKGETTDLGYTEIYDEWVPELDDYLNELLRELKTEDSIGEFVNQILTENGIRLEELNLTVKVENITEGSYMVRVMTTPM